ncbi:MAG: DHH family phosphoesterase [bacterium]|nr:DHH family phosphoesterase [bacterium]
MKQIARQIHEHLRVAEKILLIPHQNPDGDALGSASAMVEYLRGQGRTVQLFCATTAQDKYKFLAHVDNISNDPAVFTDPKIDTIILVDSGDTRYAGVDKFLVGVDATIINIDHHPTNEKYGHINLVIPTASSTAEIIYGFFKHNNIAINHHAATALLTGVVTDTDNFTNPATSTTALKMASDLLRRGGNLKLINKNIVKNKSLDALRIWGILLARLTKAEEGDIVYTYITQADLKENNVSENEADGVANFLNSMDEATISLILRETAEGKIKGSFRTTRNDRDVSAMAKKLGGGGHKKAAGFLTEGTVAEVLKRILTGV